MLSFYHHLIHLLSVHCMPCRSQPALLAIDSGFEMRVFLIVRDSNVNVTPVDVTFPKLILRLGLACNDRRPPPN